MDIEITYPDAVVVGRDFSISFLVKNNGWEDKQDVNFRFGSDESIIPYDQKEITGFYIPKISASGSHGETIDFKISPDASLGQHFLNVDYSQVLLENNETPREPTHVNIAIPIMIKEQAKVNIHTITPESIFAQAEFPFTVEILSEDIDLKNVRIQLVPPRDIEFRGETLHTFSSIQKGESLSITSRIMTPSEEVQTEYKVPFQILVSYIDDVNEEKEDSKNCIAGVKTKNFHGAYY